MKQKLVKLIALCLVLVSLMPYASAATSGVNLFTESNIDLNNVVINVGDTVSIGCDANDWWRTFPNSNYIRITMSGGGVFSLKGNDYGSGGAMAVVTGAKAGRGTLTFYIEACMKRYNDDYIESEPDIGQEDTPETDYDDWFEGVVVIPGLMPMSHTASQKQTYDYNDHSTSSKEEIVVLGTTSVSVPITVVGETMPDLPLPELAIMDANGKSCTGRTVSQEAGKTSRFTCHLVTGRLEGTNYYYAAVDNIRWNLNAKTDEYFVSHYGSGEVGVVEVDCLKGNARGTLTAYMTVALMNGREVIKTQQISSQVYLQSEKEEVKELVAGKLFDKVDVDKVPNPFVNLSKDAWYYKTFMSAYAWGLLDGIDFSEKQDGSMILSMKKTVFEGSEENVSCVFVSEKDWSAKKLCASDMDVVLHTLGSGTAKVNLLTNKKSGGFVPQGSGNRACLVQEVYNVEKGVNGNPASYMKNPFSDVSSTSTYYQAILWGADKKVVKGYGGGIFGPTRGITRQEFCVILNRYAHKNGIFLPETKKAKTFTDEGSIGSWAKNAVVACQRAGIINGYPDGSFRPNDPIEFTHATKMISQFCCK